MKHIKLINEFEFSSDNSSEKNKEVREIYDDAKFRMIEVKLRGGAVLAKHKAAEPITVLCLQGAGTFSAGTDLEDTQQMKAGTLITLEAGVEHEATANPEMHLLVTKYK